MAQEPVSINALRLISLQKVNEHKIGFLPRMEEQHTFPADLCVKIYDMCLAFRTRLPLHVWAFDLCAALSFLNFD